MKVLILYEFSNLSILTDQVKVKQLSSILRVCMYACLCFDLISYMASLQKGKIILNQDLFKVKQILFLVQQATS